MGRQKRDVPRGRFRVKTSESEKADKLYQIYIEYNVGGKAYRKATGVQCKRADWNPNGNVGRGELRPSFGTEYKRTNNALNKRIDALDADLLQYFETHHYITPDIIKGFLQDKPLTRTDEGRDFIEFVEETLKSDYSRNKIGVSRYKNGLSSLNIFRQFLIACGLGTYKKDSIFLGELTPDLLQKHIDWKREVKGNGDATINHALTPILKACDKACALGYIDTTINAMLQDMRIVIKPSNDEEEGVFDNHYLTKEQLSQLVDYYSTCQEARRQEFIEMFFFAFHACGLRVVDVMTLQWNNIDFDKKELRKCLIKTGNRHTIPLTNEAITILRKWQTMNRRAKFVFDLVPDTLSVNDDEAVYKARNNATRCINQSLSVIGERLGFTFPLTMHVARHSFAVHALNDGLNMSVVSRLLGHSSTDITEKVYAKFLPETLANEVAKLKFNFLPSL